MNDKPKHFYEFGEFRLDEAGRRLLRAVENGEAGREWEEVPLQQKVFDVLLSLVRQSQDLIERDKFLDEVWPGTSVEHHRVTANISTLRRALGDDKGAPRFISTVPSKGYRFVADVREVVETNIVAERISTHIVVDEIDANEAKGTADRQETPPEATAGLVPALPHPVSEPRTLHPKSIFLASSLVILFCCVALAFYITSGRSEKAGVAPGMPLRSLAILPFKPLVSDHADPALELGMTDALITRLGSIKGIVVRPTGSILRYTDGERNIRDIGNELDVEVLLDGKVQKVGKRVRLSVQLVRARDGAVLWAGAFDEETGDILAVQDSVSGRVAETLAWKLSGEDRERLTKIDATNGEAYELYLRGRYFWNKRSVEGLKTGLDYFKRAAEKDRNFALAYAGQADSYLLLGLRNALPAQMARDEARAAATTAIKLNESLAEPHASLARVEEFSGHWADAEREYLRATELNPNYPTARFWHSRFLLRRKRIEEAVPEAEKAHNLDPLSLPVNMNLGEVLFHARRYDGAARQFRKTRELDQNFETRQLNYYLYASYAQAGKYEEAIPPLATILSKSDALKGARIEAELSDALHAQGAQGLWRKEIEMLKRDADEDYTILFADAYVRLGEKNEAFEWLNRCADRLNWQIYFLNLDPTFDPLRSDARYAELMQRLDLQP